MVGGLHCLWVKQGSEMSRQEGGEKDRREGGEEGGQEKGGEGGGPGGRRTRESSKIMAPISELSR